MPKTAQLFDYRIGVDENGLGARLGPLVVTGVLARVTEAGEKYLARRLPKRMAADLDDSKRLVSHGDVGLGEAWARALIGAVATPEALFSALSLEGREALRQHCPAHVEAQCWAPHTDAFCADEATVERLRGHLSRLRERGVDVRGARTTILCSRRLNDERALGNNRFIADLHAMERLVVSLRQEADGNVRAVCGKVGGIDDYSRFFGPLSLRLHSVLRKSKARSEYHFPGIGEVHFVRDADARDPLVMLASLIGKYVRELLMSRVSSFYTSLDDSIVGASGYHDPVTTRFVQQTALVRKRREIPDTCFERQGVELS